MYVLSRIIVNTMNNITSAKIEALMRGIKGISIMRLPRYIVIKSQRKGMGS